LEFSLPNRHRSRLNSQETTGEQLTFFNNNQQIQQNDSIGGDKLQKAIERNRAKVARREGGSRLPTPPASAVTPQAAPARSRLPSRQDFFRDNQQAAPVANNQARTPVSGGLQRLSNRAAVVPTRKSVAKPDEAEFTSALRRDRKLPSGGIDYLNKNVSKPNISSRLKNLKETAKASKVTTSIRSSAVSAKKADVAKWSNIFVKACWALCCLAFLRLLFSHRGVIDYYVQQADFDKLAATHQEIMNGNSAIDREIELIKNDSGYQKKLIRDHLGYIAEDEYLVIFAKEEKNP